MEASRPSVSWRGLVGPVIAITAPSVVALAVLSSNGRLPLLAGVVAIAVTLVATTILVRVHLADLLAVAAYARGLSRREEPRPPAFSSPGVAAELSAAIVELRRSWAQQTSDLRALVASNESMLSALPDPLLLLGDGRRIVRANQAAHALFGRDLDDRDLASALRDPAVLDAVDAVLAGRPGATVACGSGLRLARDFQARVEPLPRTIQGAVAMLAMTDVTESRRVEQMRVDFVANVSHELRTPLSALTGFIETLEGPAREDAEARERFLPIMHQQALRMSRLVNDLLSLSRIELNEHTRPDGRVDIAAVTRTVADALEINARARDIAIVVTAEPGLPPVIGDADELAQVLTNLIDNAVKYGRRGTAVTVSAAVARERPPAMPRGEGPLVAVAVRDQGDGIAREHLPRLTERFYRVDPARSRELGGTGLGLAIVKHVVSRHRGALTVESAVGHGSTFSVTLPAAQPA